MSWPARWWSITCCSTSPSADVSAGEGNVDRNIFLQVTFDLIALTLLLYFADLPRNPFLFYFVFHMIIAGMYSARLGAVFLCGHVHDDGRRDDAAVVSAMDSGPSAALSLRSAAAASARRAGHAGDFHGLCQRACGWPCTLPRRSAATWIGRTPRLRQKEKMLGIGQLVAGIAHQIANPLDGVQNCLRRIGQGVKDDPHLTEYVQLMGEALERIERTAKRVQAFARPRGITLQSTDVNQAVDAMLEVLGAAPDGTSASARNWAMWPPCKAIPTPCRKCSSTSAPTL